MRNTEKTTIRSYLEQYFHYYDLKNDVVKLAVDPDISLIKRIKTIVRDDIERSKLGVEFENNTTDE